MTTTEARNHATDLRGAISLAARATAEVTTIVETMHQTIGGGPRVLGAPLERPVRLATRAVYGAIRGVTRVVGAGLELALQPLTPVLGESVPGPTRDAALSILNGVLGDYLEASDNPLALEMRFRRGGAALPLDDPEALARALPDARRKLLVLVHGLTMNDRQWRRGDHDHGEALARALGRTPVYLLYNTGRHISTNGEELAARLDELVAAWPVPVEDLAIVAHSMGGLVARSACWAAERARSPWRRALTSMVFLGTPHHGAPLERGGSWLETLLGISRYSAPLARLGRLRSAGITDLRYGNVLEEHWRGRDRFALGADPRGPLPLPRDVRCYAIAGAVTSSRPLELVGDGLVTVRSALGRHDDPARELGLPATRVATYDGVGHLELLSDAKVLETMCAWLRGER